MHPALKKNLEISAQPHGGAAGGCVGLGLVQVERSAAVRPVRRKPQEQLLSKGV